MKGLISSMATSIRRLVTNPAARATMIASIIIYAVIYPQPYKSEVTRDVPIVVVDQDGSNASRELIRRINSSDKVQVVSIVNNFLEAKTLFFERRLFSREEHEMDRATKRKVMLLRASKRKRS